MTDELERRLREVLDGPVGATDADGMLTRVRAGVRRRKQRRAAGIAALAVAAVLGVTSAPGLVADLVDDEQVVTPVPVPVRETVIPIGGSPCCVAVTSDGVWVLDQSDGTLQRVTSDGRLVGEPVQVGAERMQGAGDKLVLTGVDSSSVELYDPSTGESVPVPGTRSGAATTYDGRNIWVGSSEIGRLTVVRPSDGAVVDQLTIEGAANFDFMAFTEGGTLWATSWDAELMKIDVETRRVVARSMPFPQPEDYVALAAVPGALYAVSGGTDQLLRLDPTTGEVESQRQVPLSSDVGFPMLSEQPDGSLWLIVGPDHVERLDPETGEATETYRVPLPSGREAQDHYNGGFATGFGALWVGTWPQSSDEEGHLVSIPTQ